MDKIIIKGLRVYAYHGVKEEEKRKGQPFELDITLYKDLGRPGESDDLADTVNYSRVAALVLEVMKTPSRLIEHAASRTAQAVLDTFDVKGVTVRFMKPRAPVAADFTYVAVEISKGRIPGSDTV